MKVNRSAAMSVMIIRLEYPPEMRFTPGGSALVTFAAKDMARMMFQQWDNPRSFTQYELDTGEIEGTATKLTELPAGAEITVYGRCEVQHFKTPHGDKVARNVFTVSDWVYDGWEWKIARQPLGVGSERN